MTKAPDPTPPVIPARGASDAARNLPPRAGPNDVLADSARNLDIPVIPARGASDAARNLCASHPEAPGRAQLADWIGTAMVCLLAAFARFWNLARPNTLVFDETYYVKDALTLWRLGFEARWPEGIDQAFAAGDTFSHLQEAAFVVHPQVGKWLIALGMAAGGPANSWAWRLASASIGVVAVWLVARTAKRLFGSVALGLAAGLLMAVDGAAIAHSRTAILDQFLMFFVLVAFYCLIRDREQHLLWLANYSDAGASPPGGPMRWWRLAAGVSLGLACGVKWSGIYFLAGFGLLTVAWDYAARRHATSSSSFPESKIASQWLVRDALPAFAAMVPVALLTYVATWFSWFATPGAWGRDGADLLGSFWRYHLQMWGFHTGLDQPHPYSANPWGWLIQWRPTSFYWQSGAAAEAMPGCAGLTECVMTVTSLGNPLLWWLATLAIPVAVGFGVAWSDWRAFAALSGVAFGWLPWLQFTHRTVFTFYTIAFTPFIVFTLCFAFAVILEFQRRRRRAGWIVVGILLAAIVVVSVLFYPISVAMPIERSYWQWLMWLPTWI